jgi:hypothetical protein
MRMAISVPEWGVLCHGSNTIRNGHGEQKAPQDNEATWDKVSQESGRREDDFQVPSVS